ncbi:hypothetical protein Avbf_01789 [Armadillidium vulgare]|nr:hypothetical protein Avbf_01789 [Armadillidium vulgare]
MRIHMLDSILRTLSYVGIHKSLFLNSIDNNFNLTSEDLIRNSTIHMQLLVHRKSRYYIVKESEDFDKKFHNYMQLQVP